MRPLIKIGARDTRPARFLGHVLTPSTSVFAIKTKASAAIELGS